jgi:ribosomal protein S12 methylthiotransferase accessory factor
LTDHVDLLPAGETAPGEVVGEIPPERETPLPTALAAIETWLGDERLTADIRKYGSDETPTYEVRLTDARGRLCSRSSGKGLGHRSRASALFESAEHYHLDWRNDSGADDVRFLRGRDVASQPTAAASALLRRLGSVLSDNPVLVREYRPVAQIVGGDTEGVTHLHPVFLRDGGYRNWPHPGDDGSFRPLWHYTSSAGYAAGATLPEALVHAVNELIERDAWSCLLADCYFGLAVRPALRVVEKDTLPGELANLVDIVETATHDHVLIISIGCDTAVPAYVVCSADKHEDVRVIGSGASPVRSYAVQRALLEYLQVCTMLENGPVEHEREAAQIGTALARYPMHLAAARFDIHRLPHQPEPYPADPGLPEDSEPGELLPHLVGRLRAVGLEAYFRQLTKPGGIVVTDVVVPGLEMLDKARSGYPVLPTGRLAEPIRKRWKDRT